jgi:hypothetical protein
MTQIISIFMSFLQFLGGGFRSEKKAPETSSSPEEVVYEQCVPCEEDPCCLECCCCLAPYRLYLAHTEGGGLGYRHGYSTLGMFIGIPSSGAFQPFLDVRGHVFNDGRFAANAGAGLRYINFCCGTIFGVNAYYDWREGHFRHYQQIGAGIEILGRHWGFRSNVYLPFGDKTGFSSARKFTAFDPSRGTFTARCRRKETAIPGGDAEIGYYTCCGCQPYRFYAGVGPYYYHRNCRGNIWGGMGRVIVQGWDVLSLEGRAYYDRVHHGLFQGRVALTFPLGARLRKQRVSNSCALCPIDICYLKDVALQPVLRDEIIYLNNCCCWSW